MKRPTKKIAHYSALAMGAVAILPLGCKKDVVNDPNITVRDVSISVTPLGFNTNYEENIDIDANATDDFYLGIFKTDYAPFAQGGWIGRYGTNAVMATTIGAYQSATTFAEGDMIDSSDPTDTYGYVTVITTTPPFELGNAGDGNKFYGVKFKIGAETHYGWLRGTVSADGLTITINKVAWNIVADTGIEAGAE